MKSLPAQYDHAAAQVRWYPEWERRGYFHASVDPADTRPTFSIVIPPPNVTGALHLGHALNNTLQDILCRMKRMQGYNVLWMPGTDHAGIATQAVVERRLFEEQKLTRHDLGREGLVDRIWKWKEQYEARILGQLKQLGCSCDWERTRFTLDEQCARAVREWFFRLFKDGKIYRGKRLVNWDPFLQTAVSDDEVFHETVKGHFYHLKYPLVKEDVRPGEPDHVIVATTRPETMLGDTAVAVHPDPAKALDKAGAELREKLYSSPAKEKADLEKQMELLLERRVKLLPQLEKLRDMAKRGVKLELPLTGRTIPLIADEWAKPELGSGCVKITPAHDANDYGVYERHPEIGAINVMTPEGTLNDSVPEKYRGLKMHTKAREAVVADLEAAGLLAEKEDREIDLAHSDRSKTPIEPYLADQWFMKMGENLPPLPPGEGRGEGAPPTKHKQPLPADLLEFARDLRKSQTDAEKLVWSLLRNRRLGGHKFRRQHPLDPYVLDFYCHERQLAIELDGGQHNTASGRESDHKRTQFIEQHGIRVLRFWNHDVLQDTDAVLEAIWNALHSEQVATSIGAAPSPCPLPKGEGSSAPSPSRRGTEGAESFLPLPPGEGRGEGHHGLAQSAIDAVTSGRVKIVPERYAKGYLDWLGEKRDWPIGRQLWWGHRIPIWRMKDDAAIPFGKTLGDRLRTLADWVASNRVAASIGGSPFTSSNSSWSISIDVNDESSGGDVLVCVRSDQDAEIAKLLEASGFEQDSDVLDTWFSSALWPHSTMGWPDKTPELAKFYPTSTLITSRDIITLWVARMVIAGLYNMGEVPFREVYITPKILDGYGETMSKSKGNGVDPLDVIEKFGADALRFGIAYLTTDTQDVKVPVEFECPHCQATFAQTKKNRQLPRIECEKCGKPFRTQWAEKDEDKALPRGAVVSERFELGRNFANKLWNAARFSLINLEEGNRDEGTGGRESSPSPLTPAPLSLLLEDRWLLSRLSTVTQQVTEMLESYRYAEAARTLYEFAWNDFCSFYVEMTKARFAEPSPSGRGQGEGALPAGDATPPPAPLSKGEGSTRATAQRVLAHALDVLMRLLHPMMPFLTEEVWHLLGQVAPERGLTKMPAASDSVCVAPWPIADTSHQNPTIEAQFADFQAVLGAVREVRQAQNIPSKEELTFTVRCDDTTAKLLAPMQPYFAQMAKATATEWGSSAAVPDVVASRTLAGKSGPLEVHVDVSRFIDVAAERKRLEKDRDGKTKQADGIRGKLSNAAFVDKAPPAVVEDQRAKLAEVEAQLASIVAALAKLK